MRIALIIFLLAFIASLQLYSQERMYGLDFSPQVRKKFHEAGVSRLKKSEQLINIPFFDDFSTISVWPSEARWVDNLSFINSDYAKNPPTYGVATLDAIDETGALYSDAGPYQFEADYLTSQPIRLDSIFAPIHRAIKKSDSLYLSFYYQPQGRGAMPAKKDSLILQFHSPLEVDTIITEETTLLIPRWHTVWSAAGGVQVDSFAVENRQYFSQILIPIDDSARYFQKGFQFRFHNYASLANNYVPDWQSNGDHWNIDMVYLNIGRSVNDTSFRDVAFADRAPSMLMNYEAMPYNQYVSNYINEMKDSLDIKISNLDKNDQNASYEYYVQRDSNPPSMQYDGGSYTLTPFATDGYVDYLPFSKPRVDVHFKVSENPEKTAFNISHVLTTDPSTFFPGNDTIRFTQLFSNYYAYDDGTAEAGIGLNGASGSYAVKFSMNVPDSMLGIQLYFNQVLSGSSDKFIDLTVWNEKYGKPDGIVKQMKAVTPIYSDSLNCYTTYWFESPLKLDAGSIPGLVFYVGWVQSSIDNLNIGLDRYNDTHQNRFYNVDGNWQMSDELHAGSVMLRPILGRRNPVHVQENPAEELPYVYPNPARGDLLHIHLPSGWSVSGYNEISCSILSTSGQVLIAVNNPESINISTLGSGMYFARLQEHTTGRTVILKFIVIR